MRHEQIMKNEDKMRQSTNIDMSMLVLNQKVFYKILYKAVHLMETGYCVFLVNVYVFYLEL